jgi:HAD superfamily hydrolase (TIGR01490 family)
MNIAFFDFDGTITNKDTFRGFIRFYKGEMRYLLGIAILSPIFLAYAFKLISREETKVKLLTYFFRGESEDKFIAIANQYSAQNLDSVIRPLAIKEIHSYQEKGDKVVIVSASLEYWLKPWCAKNALDIIGTKMEIKDGVLTGKLLANNCYGQEKVNRIKQNYQVGNYDKIFAYGDSRGDLEMLEFAHTSYYKPFRTEQSN